MHVRHQKTGNFNRILLLIVFLLTVFFSFGCGAGSSLDDLLDLVKNPPERKPIDITKMGVNDFFVNSEFGSTAAQYSNIQNDLGLHFVRVLFAWTDSVQPSPAASINFSLYDKIIENIPAGVDVLVVVAHTPSWMADSGNWIAGNPRQTWVERFLRPNLERYGANGRIVGWEIWNEPDFTVVPSDSALGLEDPAKYVEMLGMANPLVRQLSPGKKIVLAASRSIQQNFSTNLAYNQTMRDLGAATLADVWNIHFYGEQYENVVRKNGVQDFLNSLGMPIWVTESGEQGPNNQLAYVETAWPYLSEKVPAIERFYYYEYGSTIGVDQNYGLRTTDPAFPISDLYLYLADQH